MARLHSLSVLVGVLLCFMGLWVSLSAADPEGMFVYLNEGNKKCFLEEVPVNTLVQIKFTGKITSGEAPESGDPLGITVSVEAPDQSITQRQMDLQGRHAFTAGISGEHKICLEINRQRWFGRGITVELDLSIETGVRATNYEELANKEHLSALEISIRRLNDAVRSIIAESTKRNERQHSGTPASPPTPASCGGPLAKRRFSWLPPTGKSFT
ncbi:Transmembrane emp24 domain-containing protein 9 [Balamuthia mandrillaris]